MTRMAIIAHGGAGADPEKATNIQSAVDAGGPNSLKEPLLWRWQ